ncbi:MAG: 4-alpha-glucanotransferase [Actinomycetota bacterium]
MYDEWGIAHGYHDVTGGWHETPADTRERFRLLLDATPAADPIWFVDAGTTHALIGRCHLALEDGSELGEVDALPADLPIGYHRLAPLDGGPVTTVVVAPRRCPRPPYGWGVAAQVYSLWRDDAWGIGDLRDITDLGQRVAARGGIALLLSPMHAPAPTASQEASPYYPSSRRWLNPLLIPIAGSTPDTVANAPGILIDRDRVWAAKRQFLTERFQVEAGGHEWRSWARAQGNDLWRFATWNALADRHGAQWTQWPAAFRHPDSPAVGDLPMHDHQFAADCEFHAWLQWVARGEVRRTAVAAGVALISDLAVGNSPDGADAWMYQDLIASGVRIGAPPDSFNADGQDWGLPPFVPARLRSVHYAPFVGMLRAACENMGGVRIDHVMGLFRQFWVPDGGTPVDGAYVRMPADDLLAIIRLEAVRAGTFVVGEDLGTVQPGVREALAEGGILGTKVWWFDPNPAEWSPGNLATVTTHDLPTVAGVWAGADGSPEMQSLLRGAAPAGADAIGAAVAVHAEVAQSHCALALATFDDLAGCGERPNRPGTVEGTNWSRRMPAPADRVLADEPGRSLVAVFDARSGTPYR